MEKLKTILLAPFRALKWTSDKLGPIVTLGGLMLIPFFFVSAAKAAAVGGALTAKGATATAAVAAPTVTNGAVATSFWSGLYTDPVTGTKGISSFFNNMVVGAPILAKSVFNIVAPTVAAIGGPESVTQAFSSAWNAPIPA